MQQAEFGSQSVVLYGTRTDTPITAPIDIENGQKLALFLLIGKSGAPPPVTPHAGFAEIVDATGTDYPLSVTNGGFVVEAHFYWKDADNESGDYTFEHDEASTAAWMFTVKNAKPGAPTLSGGTSGGTDPVAPGLIPAAAQALAAFFAQSFNFLGAVTPPAGFTERLDSAASILYGATIELATADPTGDQTVTVSQGPSSAGLVLFEGADDPPPPPQSSTRKRRRMLLDATPIKVLANAATDETTSETFGLTDDIIVSVEFKAGVTAGVVTFESAPRADYQGAWKSEATITFTGTAPLNLSERVTPENAVGRLRISTQISDGVIDAYIQRSFVGR